MYLIYAFLNLKTHQLGDTLMATEAHVDSDSNFQPIEKHSPKIAPGPLSFFALLVSFALTGLLVWWFSSAVG